MSLLTVDNDDGFLVVLAFLRELEERAPEHIWWYEQRGKNGKAELLRPSGSALAGLRQWVAIAIDEEIGALFDKLIETRVLELKFPSSDSQNALRKFVLPGELIPRPPNDVDQYAINRDGDNVPLSSEYRKNYWGHSDWHNAFHPISAALRQRTNLSSLCETTANGQKVFFPLGAFDASELTRLFTKKIVMVRQSRGIQVDFRATGTRNEEGEYLHYEGFVQGDAAKRASWLLTILDDSGVECGNTVIDKSKGEWAIKLSRAIGRGIIRLTDRGPETQTLLGSQRFYIIKEFSLKLRAISKVVHDLFERDLSLPAEDPRPLDALLPYSWLLNTRMDRQEAPMELSDHIAEVLMNLGPHLVIKDPFGLGLLDSADHKVALRSVGQKVFLNALVRAMAQDTLKEITFLLRFKDGKSPGIADREGLVAAYGLLFGQFRKLGKISMMVAFADTDFHDRDWVSLNARKVVHVSTSLSSLTENKELKLMLLDSESSENTMWQISEMLSSADTRNVL